MLLKDFCRIACGCLAILMGCAMPLFALAAYRWLPDFFNPMTGEFADGTKYCKDGGVGQMALFFSTCFSGIAMLMAGAWLLSPPPNKGGQS